MPAITTSSTVIARSAATRQSRALPIDIGLTPLDCFAALAMTMCGRAVAIGTLCLFFHQRHCPNHHLAPCRLYAAGLGRPAHRAGGDRDQGLPGFVRRRACAGDDGPLGRRHRAFAPDGVEAGIHQAQRLPGDDLRGDDCAGRQTSFGAWLAVAAPAQGYPADRRHRRYRLQDQRRRRAEMRRSERLSLRGHRGGRCGVEAGYRAACRRLSVPREPMPRRQCRLRRYRLGLWPRCLAGGFPRSGCSAAEGRALGDGAGQSRKLQPCGPRLAAFLRYLSPDPESHLRRSRQRQ